MLRYLTAGESHGKGIIAILDGIPAHLPVLVEEINRELARRQIGYGRGGRMSIEKDRVELISGIRHGKTIGSPITLLIRNLDWENWREVMAPQPGNDVPESGKREVTRPRPGHADLAGALKYNEYDIRNILERASARETAARVAAGAVCKRLLREFGIKVFSWVVEIGGVGISSRFKVQDSKIEDIFLKAEDSVVRCPDKETETLMKRRIEEARSKGDSVGGIFEIVVTGVPPGLGSHTQWDRKLNARLSYAVMSIQAIKGVEIGMGFEVSKRFGSEVHDEIFYTFQGSDMDESDKEPEAWPVEPRFYRKTNNAGGIEGGMSNGEPIVLRAVMKPIPTLVAPLKSADIVTKEPFDAAKERSDVCAVPAASVVAEAVVAFEVARAFLDKFGRDSLEEVRRNYKAYLRALIRF